MLTWENIGPILAVVVPIATGSLGSGIWWVVSRISTHDKALAVYSQAFTDLKELIESRFDSVDQRMERIERKVLNGDYRPTYQGDSDVH